VRSSLSLFPLGGHEGFDSNIQLKIGQFRKNAVFDYLAEVAIAQYLDHNTCRTARGPEMFVKRLTRFKIVYQLRDLASEPLTMGLVLTAMPPSRVAIGARQQTAFRSLPLVANAMHEVRI
jgi:hypothetical protein